MSDYSASYWVILQNRYGEYMPTQMHVDESAPGNLRSVIKFMLHDTYNSFWTCVRKSHTLKGPMY